MFRSLLMSFRSNLATGVLVLAPIGAMFGILAWMWNQVVGLSGILPESFHPRVFLALTDPWAIRLLDALATIFILFVILLILAFVGLVSRNFLGKRLLRAIGQLFARVPVLSTVYSTLEQLLETFASGKAKNFRRVVQIEYPRPGLYTLALVTGERDNHPITHQKEKFLNIFVPTTPNPTSGFYLTIAAKDAVEVKITVEEALKEIISMGIVQSDEHF